MEERFGTVSGRTLHIKIRWGKVFAPVCRVKGHRWVDVMGLPSIFGGRLCRRCDLFQTYKQWALYEAKREGSTRHETGSTAQQSPREG